MKNGFAYPFRKEAAYSPESIGSSPGVSTLRPHRGSRARLTTGAQNVSLKRFGWAKSL